MFERTNPPYGRPVADPARAVARGPLQLSGFEPRPPRRLPLLAAFIVYLAGLASALLILAGGLP